MRSFLLTVGQLMYIWGQVFRLDLSTRKAPQEALGILS